MPQNQATAQMLGGSRKNLGPGKGSARAPQKMGGDGSEPVGVGPADPNSAPAGHVLPAAGVGGKPTKLTKDLGRVNDV